MGTLQKEDRGGGPTPIINTDNQSQLCSAKTKRSIVFIPAIENENICAARAIVTCMAKLQGMPRNQFKCFINKARSRSLEDNSQKSQALKLQREVGLSLEEPVMVRDLYLFEEYLNVQIIVISVELLNEVCYTGYSDREKKIYLYLKDSHFHSIVNIQGLLPYKSLCTHCFTWYCRRGKNHTCTASCIVCKRDNCTFDGSGVICQDCNVTCRKCRMLPVSQDPPKTQTRSISRSA